MRKFKKYIIGVIVVGLVVAGGLFLVHSKNKPADYEEYEIDRGQVKKVIDVDAQVKPEIYADISSELPVLVKDVFVKENEVVSKGQKLFTLDQKSVNAQIAQARLAVEKAELAEKNKRRHWDLLKPEEKMEIKKTTEEARQRLNEIYAQASKLTIVSPIDGVVVRKNVNPGEVASGIAMKISNLNSLRVEALIPEVDIGLVQIGSLAEVSLDAYPDKILTGKIISIDSTSTTKENSTYYRAIIKPDDLQGVRFLEGMNAEVDIITDKKENVLRVDRDFAKKDEQGYFVYLLNSGDDKKPVKKYFQAGLAGEDFVEVKSGLSVGDRVVLSDKQE